MIEFLYSQGYPFLIVATKSDKLNKSERAAREQGLEEELVKYSDVNRIAFSTINGEGVESLRSIISESVENN